MYCLGYAERPHSANQLSFMLHELASILGVSLKFVSYLYTFASYSHSYKILQPYVAAKVRIHSDAIYFLYRCFSNENIHQKSMLIKK